MWHQHFWKTLIFLSLCLQLPIQGKRHKTSVKLDIYDFKGLKKLLKSKTNVLVQLVNSPKLSQGVSEIFKEVADNMKGKATLVIIDCFTSEGKKLCKKLKVPPDAPFSIKHFKNGEFHKDYDRGLTASAMVNFLRDPSGDLPWEEDPKATDIMHLADEEALSKFLSKGMALYQKSMVMFYAPWCAHCKVLKPHYSAAAADLKGEAVLAAIDLSKPGNSNLRQLYNISGFPTLLYFENGHYKFPYNGEYKRRAIVKFMLDPNTQLLNKEVVDDTWSKDTDVVHLTEETFDTVVVKPDHVLVVFYAPWCTHCKRIKPEFEKAATKIKDLKLNAMLAAVDATEQYKLSKRFGVHAYPVIKYFHKGKFLFNAEHLRHEEEIINFVKSPEEPPPPEPLWSEDVNAVRHPDATVFKNTLRRIKHALVIFYTPWCGHCKITKPEFMQAAEHFANELIVAFVAVDCTQHHDLCDNYNVKTYPTIKYLSYYDKIVMDYTGGRKDVDFVAFLYAKMNIKGPPQTLKTNYRAGFGPDVVMAADNDFNGIITTPNPTFVMFYAMWCSHCSTAKPAYSRLANALKNESIPVKAIAINAVDNPKTAEIAGIETLPAFKIYAKGKFLADYEGDRSTEDMLRFCKSFVNAKDEL